MQLLKEMKGRDFPTNATQARVHCRVFEDNSGALELARIRKYCTKPLNVRLHYFRDHVVWKEISIHHTKTGNQPADFLTKPLNEETLLRHRHVVLRW
jgi:hypothetical protein